jgi:hypothetical protein
VTPTLRFLLSPPCLVLLVLVLVLPAAHAAPSCRSRWFDHSTTGFELDGAPACDLPRRGRVPGHAARLRRLPQPRHTL